MNPIRRSGLTIESEDSMKNEYPQEKLTEMHVTYTLDVGGRLVVVENVPARVNLETGEQLFSPETVEHLQQMLAEHRTPKRIMQVPVYEFA